ncbi:ATP-binding protein [Thalassospira indica]|uniref:ATP-binding protein n=1 Tax=Thalassospira indica TaxID=1891279 RepID=UPI0007EA0529|nr:AAA family ATPase [Thalassospira indica]OAZ14135.1 hypothetical protein TH15_07875 [Thalassospira profundimaris]
MVLKSKRTIVLSGISGIGKSTIISELNRTLVFEHLQASALIQKFFQSKQEQNYTSEQLRTGNIEENQIALSEALKALPSNKNYIFDSHTVIDTPDGLVAVEPTIFEPATPKHFIFLFEPPVIIQQRRERDHTRERPERSTEQITEYQNLALINCAMIATHFNVPMTVLSTSKISEIAELAQNYFTQSM